MWVEKEGGGGGGLVEDDEKVVGLGEDIGCRKLAAREDKRVRFGPRDRNGRGVGTAHRERTRRRREIDDAVVQQRGGPRIRGGEHGRRRALRMRKQGRRLRRHGFLLPCSQRGFGGALDAAEAVFVERAAEAAEEHPAGEPSGRASCWERGCQSVENSVV